MKFKRFDIKKTLTIVLVLLFVCCKQQSINLDSLQPYESTLIQDTENYFSLYKDSINSYKGFNIIALKEFDYRDDNGKPYFKTIDTLRVKVSPSQILTTTYCNNWQEQYVILGSDATADNFGEIIKAWTINDKSTKLIESNVANLDCLNENSIE